MVKVIVVVREVGREKPEYSLPFELPEAPKPGDYISIFRPDVPHHPETRGAVRSKDLTTGHLKDIMVECDVAIGPHAQERWKAAAEAAEKQGIDIVRFKVSRVRISESDLDPKV